LWDESATPVPGPDFSYSFHPSHPSVGALTLKVGDHVYHGNFGPGIVMACNPTNVDQELTVVFEQAGVKKLLASLAPLERIEKDSDFPS
jgi:hypothetical protein